MLNSEIHIIKDEYSESGKLEKTCNGDILVSKCEGYCNSQVQPSIVTSTGFLKECFCCREIYLKEVIILLDHCYDANGVRIHQENEATLEVKIRTPGGYYYIDKQLRAKKLLLERQCGIDSNTRRQVRAQKRGVSFGNLHLSSSSDAYEIKHQLAQQI
ncbi:PREDICTED: partner of bursicon [Ceratosolen solmsi marchali]|uniref:Partner of bursicon n=1 Tax=Ceratosolen solmsi marchali TaxID=326594 RepID=A0AAJ7E146_9HYME|nr:PREDICTED: partner of bursicon [Ceratosolen solmsi marchali]